MKFIEIITLAFLASLSVGCTTEFFNDCIEATESSVFRTLEFDPIQRIELGMDVDLVLKEGPQNIEIEGPLDIIEMIEEQSFPSNGRWNIELDKCYKGPGITVRATLPSIEELSISGSGDIRSQGVLNNITDLEIDIEGSGDIALTIGDANKIEVNIDGSGSVDLDGDNIQNHLYTIDGSGDVVVLFDDGVTCESSIKGSGDIKLRGKVNDHFIRISGDGDMVAEKLCTQNSEIVIVGSGDCDVKVSDNLDIRITGSGDVCYTGMPTITETTLGSGRVRNCN